MCLWMGFYANGEQVGIKGFGEFRLEGRGHSFLFDQSAIEARESSLGQYVLKNVKGIMLLLTDRGCAKGDHHSWNLCGVFHFYPFPQVLQVAPILALVIYDFDGDGKDDVLAGGNYFGVKPFQGRFDAFSGALIMSDTTFISGHKIGLELTNKSVRGMNIISVDKIDYLLVTINNEKVQLYKLIN